MNDLDDRLTKLCFVLCPRGEGKGGKGQRAKGQRGKGAKGVFWMDDWIQ